MLSVLIIVRIFFNPTSTHFFITQSLFCDFFAATGFAIIFFLTGANEGTVSEKATLVDVVSYEGLTPGNTYKLFTTLMDKEIGEAFVDANSEAIVAETTFTPEASDGEVEVELTLETSELAGKSVVFFESLADAVTAVCAASAVVVGCGAVDAAYTLNKRRKTKTADEEVEESEVVTAPLN